MSSKTFCSDIIELCDVLRADVIDTTGAEIPDSVRTITWNLNLNELLQVSGVRMPVPYETGSDEARGDAADSGNSGAKIQYMYNALHGQTGALCNFLNALKQSRDIANQPVGAASYPNVASDPNETTDFYSSISEAVITSTAHWYDENNYPTITNVNVHDQVKLGLHDLFESGPNDPNDLNDGNTASYGDVVLSSNKIRDTMRNAGTVDNYTGEPGTDAKDLNAKFISLRQLRDVLGQAADLGLGSQTAYNADSEYTDRGEARFDFDADDALCFGVDVRDETILNNVQNGQSGFVNVDRWTIKLVHKE